MAETNREVEVYPLSGKTKQDLEFILEKKQVEIMALAAGNVKGDSAYLLRAKTELLSGPCAPLLKTGPGMQSAIKAITDTAMIGLSFGGPRPMAYFVPKEGKVTPIYEASGYKYAVTYGPGAILLKYPSTIIVREGDSVKVDPVKRTIVYKEGGYNPFDPNRGKVAGFLMILEYKDGRLPDIREIDMAKVKKIQKNYSNPSNAMLTKSDEEADLKTAEKSMLRLAFKESCQRAQVALEEGVEFDDGDELYQPPVERDVTARTLKTVDAAVARLDPENAAEPVDALADRVEEDSHEMSGDPPSLNPEADQQAEEDLFK